MDIIKYLFTAQLKAACIMSPILLTFVCIIFNKNLKETVFIYINLLAVVSYFWFTSQHKSMVYIQMFIFFIALLLIICYGLYKKNTNI